jgi:adenylate cyclase
VRKAIATNPNLPDAHYTLGTMLFEARQFVEAEREFVETVRLDPSDYKAHNNAGLCCFRQARIDDAAIHFEEVLRLHPEDEIAKGNLALLAQARRTLNARK